MDDFLAITIGAKSWHLVDILTKLHLNMILTFYKVDSLYRKAKDAIAARDEHVAAFIEFSAALPQQYTKEWTQQCITWENDRSQTTHMKCRKECVSCRSSLTPGEGGVRRC